MNEYRAFLAHLIDLLCKWYFCHRNERCRKLFEKIGHTSPSFCELIVYIKFKILTAVQVKIRKYFFKLMTLFPRDFRGYLFLMIVKVFDAGKR